MVFIDTNRTDPLFIIFTSSHKVKHNCNLNEGDVVIKTIMYSTSKKTIDDDFDFDIKLLTQYPDKFTFYKFQEIKQSKEMSLLGAHKQI